MQAEIQQDNDVSVNLTELNSISTHIRLRIHGMPWHVYNKIKDLPTCAFMNIVEEEQPNRFRRTDPENRQVTVDVAIRYTFTKTNEQIEEAARKCFQLSLSFENLFEETPEVHRELLCILDPYFERNLLMQQHKVLSLVDTWKPFHEYFGTANVQYSNNPMLTLACVNIDTANTKFTEIAKASVLEIMRQRYKASKHEAEFELVSHALELDGLETGIANLKHEIKTDALNGRQKAVSLTQKLGALIVKRTGAVNKLNFAESNTRATYAQDELETVQLLHLQLK